MRSDDDGIEIRVRGYSFIHAPYVTYRMMVDEECIGYLWSDGTVTLGFKPAHQESAAPMSGAPPK